MISQSILDIAELIQDISKLVLKSCFIIKEISQNFTQIYYKDNHYDPVTQADYLVQHTITSLINQKYPGLRIVGQENISPDDQMFKKVLRKGKTMSFHNINQDELIQNFPIKKTNYALNISQLCLWIDPLDCTRGFVSNKKQEVTILVGITQNHKPIAGVIGQPFKLDQQKGCCFDPRIFMGSIYFNIPNQKKFSYQYRYFKRSWIKWEQFHQTKHSAIKNKVAISSRRIPERQHALMNEINLQKYQIGGAGSKFVKLIRKQVATLMFIDAKTSKWDSCAGEAIIKAMGGFAIKPNLEQIIYNPDHQHANCEGFIISLSKNIFDDIKEYISTNEFQNFSSDSKNQTCTLVL